MTVRQNSVVVLIESSHGEDDCFRLMSCMGKL